MRTHQVVCWTTGFARFTLNYKQGVRRGDPLSPCLFIFAAEILATAIRNRSNIQGIKIGQDEFKLVQYGDDLNVFVPDIESAKRVFELLDLVDLFWFKGQFFQNWGYVDWFVPAKHGNTSWLEMV